MIFFNSLFQFFEIYVELPIAANIFQAFRLYFFPLLLSHLISNSLIVYQAFLIFLLSA